MERPLKLLLAVLEMLTRRRKEKRRNLLLFQLLTSYTSFKAILKDKKTLNLRLLNKYALILTAIETELSILMSFNKWYWLLLTTLTEIWLLPERKQVEKALRK